MKSLLALVTLALVTLVLEEKGRQVAGEAQQAYGQAVDHARDATKSLSRNVEQRPLAALLIAGAVGYMLSSFIPHR
jgi:hypothetical protein